MNTSQSKWYDKTWLVVVFCLFFFPVGLYALWRNSSIKMGWKVIISFFFAVMFLGYLSQDTKKSVPGEVKLEQNKSRKELVQEQFSKWDGSHSKLVQYIKANMNDADSYEHVETLYIVDSDSSIYVTTKFRGTNALGAKVLNEIKARYSFDGSMIEIVQ